MRGGDSRNGSHFSYQYERWRHLELLGQRLTRIITTETKRGVFGSLRQEIACTGSGGKGKRNTLELLRQGMAHTRLYKETRSGKFEIMNGT